jgi:hypothetical protein
VRMRRYRGLFRLHKFRRIILLLHHQYVRIDFRQDKHSLPLDLASFDK